MAAGSLRGKVNVSRFTWGEVVRVSSDSGLHEREGLSAAVCGIKTIESIEHATKVVGGRLGATAYLIEFSDGFSVEVVENLLVR